MRVLFAWEMGRNLGHVTKIADIAVALAAAGDEVYLALQNPVAGAVFVTGERLHLLQAPFRAPRRPAPGFRPLLYSDELLACGYESVDSLAPLLRCWHTLFDLVRPDLLVVQAAPTALLAARGRGFFRAHVGTGYDAPPPLRPLPPLRYWEKQDAADLARREQAVVATINAAVALTQGTPITAIADIFDCDRTFVCTYPELDHYPVRPGATYYDPDDKNDVGVEVRWRTDSKRRIFAYLSPDAPAFQACLRALTELPPGHEAILAAPGLQDADCERLRRPSLRVLNQPARLDRLLGDCDLGINHGSPGVCSLLARSGVPSLMFPQHVEQLMFTRRMVQASLGLAMTPQAEPRQIGAAIGRLLADRKIRDHARAFASRHDAGTSQPGSVAQRIASELRELVASATD